MCITLVIHQESSSGTISLCKWLLVMPVRREKKIKLKVTKYKIGNKGSVAVYSISELLKIANRDLHWFSEVERERRLWQIWRNSLLFFFFSRHRRNRQHSLELLTASCWRRKTNSQIRDLLKTAPTCAETIMR